MVEAITNIPVAFDRETLMKRVRITPHTDDAGEFGEFLETACEAAVPKALFAESFVEASGDSTVLIGGVTFKSRMLRKNLENTVRVFPFVATCGHELDEAAPCGDDFLKKFWWDEIKAAALECAIRHLDRHLQHRFRLGGTSQMSPGAADADVWPIRQQKQLFELLGDVKKLIGVELTPSFLMLPNKSVSGIRFRTEADFRSCQVCRREDCSNRVAPLDEQLRRSIQPG